MTDPASILTGRGPPATVLASWRSATLKLDSHMKYKRILVNRRRQLELVHSG
jgi:hypothetical protein